MNMVYVQYTYISFTLIDVCLLFHFIRLIITISSLLQPSLCMRVRLHVCMRVLCTCKFLRERELMNIHVQNNDSIEIFEHTRGA